MERRGDLRGLGLLDEARLGEDQGGAVRRDEDPLDEDPLDGVQPDGARAGEAGDDVLRRDGLVVRVLRAGVRGPRGSW